MVHESYTLARQSAGCRGRYCLREVRPVKLNKIQRRFQLSGKVRSSHVMLADEQPRELWCDNRCRVVREILDLSGMELQADRLPLIDGDRSSIRNVLGSVRDIRVRDGKLYGTISWARCKRSQDAQAKWEDGHLDAPIDLESFAGEIEEHAEGFRGVAGPVDFVRKWHPVSVRLRSAVGD